MKILPLPFLLQKLCGILSTIADDAEVSIFYSDNHVIIKSRKNQVRSADYRCRAVSNYERADGIPIFLRYAMHEV